MESTENNIDIESPLDQILKKLNSINSLPPIMDSKQAAAFLRIKAQTLNLWRSQGRGPNYIRIGGNAIRYRLEDLNDYLKKQTVVTS